MWHIMVYSRGFESAYHHPYAVHLFASGSLSPGEAFKIAEDVLVKHFPEWVKLGERLVYVGYEYLPIDLPGSVHYYVAVKLEYAGFGRFEVVSSASTVPQHLASAVEGYRRKWVTLDYDHDIDETKVLLLDVLDCFSGARVFKTRRGYHVRAELPSPLELSEILEVRSKLNDDFRRVALDKAYLRSGFGFLTNLLFNAKCWVAGGSIECYEEKEVDTAALTAVRVETLSIPLPPMKLSLPKGTVEISGREVRFVGSFTRRDVESIVKSIEDNLWEYSRTYVHRAKDEDIKTKVAKAYEKISPSLARVVKECDVKIEDGTVVIHIPQHLQQHVGRLIGKQGANIRAVEAELGVRIKISQTSPPPEDVEMKKKLQELLRRVV